MSCSFSLLPLFVGRVEVVFREPSRNTGVSVSAKPLMSAAKARHQPLTVGVWRARLLAVLVGSLSPLAFVLDAHQISLSSPSLQPIAAGWDSPHR